MGRTTVASLLFFTTTAVAQSQPAKPLHKEQVTAMVGDGLADQAGAKLVKERGVDFIPDQAFTDSLRAAGADDAFVKALREAPHPSASLKKPLNQTQVRMLVTAGIGSSRIAALVSDRGIDFDPSDDYLQQLRKAGAEQEVVVALNKAERIRQPEDATLSPANPGVRKTSTATSSEASEEAHIHVRGVEQAAKLVYQEKPEYPSLAIMARVQGIVRLQTLIDRDGSVEDVKVITGHPLLIESALLAVSKWRYRPTLLDGKPVPVATEVDVSFKLAP